MKNKDWNTREIATLKEIWEKQGPLKIYADLIPGRTVRAMQVKAQTIGLKPRGKKSCAYTSGVRRAIDAELSKGFPLSVASLSERLNIPINSINSIILLDRKKEDKRYYVAAYARKNGAGAYTYRYLLGSEDDAPRPKRMPRKDVQRRGRRLKKEREQFNPFARLAA